MKPCELLHAPWRLIALGMAALRCPRARLIFRTDRAAPKIRATYAVFNRRHARLPLIRNKTMGIALINLRQFGSAADYLATVKKKDLAGHHSRQARQRGYSVRRIDRNAHIAEIFRIHRSSATRQGRPMDQRYLQLETRYDDSEPLQVLGVFNADNILMGYCCFGIYGNFAATDRLLGIKNGDGIMYLLLLEIICSLIDQSQLDYFMYDTFLGAQPGLRSFKQRIGFQPYRVSYALI
jgi:hypothetical protein